VLNPGLDVGLLADDGLTGRAARLEAIILTTLLVMTAAVAVIARVVARVTARPRRARVLASATTAVAAVSVTASAVTAVLLISYTRRSSHLGPSGKSFSLIKASSFGLNLSS